jgi:MFS transporter, ACS family, tartrate transporter
MAIRVESRIPVGAAWEAAVSRSAIRKIYLRVVLLLMIANLFSMLDRFSVGIAALDMNKDLGLTATTFSAGAGLLFVGYAFFEIPSVIVGRRFGARRWMCRCLVTWGALTAFTACIRMPIEFHVLRFLTGMAEAGFYPMALFYIARWVPPESLGKANSLFVFGATLSHIVGSPVSGLLLTLEGWVGMHGWQWLFILEGGATVVFGLLMYVCLDDRIADSRWLSGDEKRWLAERLSREGTASEVIGLRSALTALVSRDIWLLGLAFAGIAGAFYGFLLWFPQVVKDAGFSSAQTGLIAGLPSLAGTVALFLWSAHSDRTGERVWHTTLPLLAAGVAGLACAAPAINDVVLFAALLVLSVGLLIAMPVFWAMSTAYTGSIELASAFAAISSIGNLGGFVGSCLMGWVRVWSGSLAVAFAAVSTLPFIAAILLVTLHYRRPTKRRSSSMQH